MNVEDKKILFIRKMIEAWTLLLEDSTESKVEKENNLSARDMDIEEVRKILLEKTQEGKSEKVRDLLHSFQVEKLSDLDKSYYGKLIEGAKEI